MPLHDSACRCMVGDHCHHIHRQAAAACAMQQIMQAVQFFRHEDDDAAARRRIVHRPFHGKGCGYRCGELRAQRCVLSCGEIDAHKKAVGRGIAELRRFVDETVVRCQESRHGGNNAAHIGAGEGENEAGHAVGMSGVVPEVKKAYSPSMMTEHRRIAQFFAPLTVGEPGSFALTDDAAVLLPPTEDALVITTDSVIEGIHVLPGATPQQFARKLMRRNLSDLAAMGAVPWRYLVNLHTPAAIDDAWIAAFAATLAQEQAEYGMVLIGGDSTTSGERIHTTMTCLGRVHGAPLQRSGACVGDDVYVSGTIGDAALGLRLLQQATASSHDFLIDRYHRPQPRLALGQALAGIATACMDISDGLTADAAHIAAASGVALHIDPAAIPLSEQARAVLQTYPEWREAIATGGDDYELLFTAPPSAAQTVAAIAAAVGLPVTRIGLVTAPGSVS